MRVMKIGDTVKFYYGPSNSVTTKITETKRGGQVKVEHLTGWFPREVFTLVEQGLPKKRLAVKGTSHWINALAGIWLKEQPEVVQQTLKKHI